MSSQDARLDRNHVPSGLGVAGTTGTAAVGTEDLVQFRADPATGAQYVFDLGGGGGGGGNPSSGTLNTLGTVGTILGIGGTVTVTGNLGAAGGTIGSAIGTTVTPGGAKLNGTAAALTDADATNQPLRVDQFGGLYSDLVTKLDSVNDSITSVFNSGTITSVGTDVGVGTVSNLGSLNTVTNVVNIANLAKGTISAAAIAAGTLNTLGTVGNLNNGTLQTMSGSTLALADNVGNPTLPIAAGYMMAYDTTQWGRVRQGIGDQAAATGMINIVPMSYNGATYDRVRQNIGTSLATVGTTGVAVWGTLVAASGAGTKQYVSGLSIVVTSGTVDVAVTNIGIGGSTGAGVLARGQFPAGGGIARDFTVTKASGGNGTLAYWLGGAGTVAITIDYWQAT